jgi:hypothetical protein
MRPAGPFLLVARIGWVHILMPGVDMARLRDLTTGAPCLRINGEWAWWTDAVYLAVPIPRRTVPPP